MDEIHNSIVGFFFFGADYDDITGLQSQSEGLPQKLFRLSFVNCTAIPKVLLSSIGFYIINTSLLILKIPELCLQLIAESRVSKKVDFSSCTIFPSVGKVKLFPFLSPLDFKPFGTGVFTIHHH